MEKPYWKRKKMTNLLVYTSTSKSDEECWHGFLSSYREQQQQQQQQQIYNSYNANYNYKDVEERSNMIQ